MTDADAEPNDEKTTKGKTTREIVIHVAPRGAFPKIVNPLEELQESIKRWTFEASPFVRLAEEIKAKHEGALSEAFSPIRWGLADAIQQSLGRPIFMAYQENVRRLFDFSSVLPNYSKLLEGILPKIEYGELFRRLQPANWADVPDDIDPFALIDLAEEGIPTAWVPRAEVLVALVSADVDKRLQVLLDHQGQVLEDCDVTLSETSQGAHAEQMVLLVQAVASARLCLFAPAQAIAASVLDTLIRKSMSPGEKYSAWLRKHPADKSWPIGQMRYFTAMTPMSRAFKEFWKSKGDPIPDAFNRHASTHAAGAIQYTEGNALVGVMLAVSVLRELHEKDEEARRAAEAEDEEDNV
ncbi:hypothetical protein [Catellatospora sp. NPDC049609]|uniref:hypothetical protein n=1 Tax=Catellatospora sp. NPDC049609 TaxID=3155505 RepID=UPI00341978F0